MTVLPMLTLTEQVELLAQARADLANEKAKLDAARKAFNEQNAAVIAAVEAKMKTVAELETSVKGIELELFTASGEKKPLEGLETKLFNKVVYVPFEALGWCIVHKPEFVQIILLSDYWEKWVIKEQDKIGVVDDLKDIPAKVVKEPKATIASDLSAYLPKKEDPHE